MKLKLPKIFVRKVFLNSKTGQASIVLPKKQFNFHGKIPKEISIEIKRIKWLPHKS